MFSGSLAELVTNANTSQTEEQNTLNYCKVAGAAWLLYEYVITLGQENRFVWRDFRAGYTVLFLLNRLNMLCLAISVILPTFTHTIMRAAVLWQIASTSTFILWAATSAFRVYALSNRSLLLATLATALALGPAVINVFGDVKTYYYLRRFDASMICDASYNIRAQTSSNRTTLIASDVIVLMVTWWQLRGTIRPPRPRHGHSELIMTLLRDSESTSVRCRLFLLINVAQIISEMMLGDVFDPIPSFMLPMTSIVISRVILNLRQLSYSRRSPAQSRSTTATQTMDTHISTEPINRSWLSTMLFRQGSTEQHGETNQNPLVPPESSEATEDECIDVNEYELDEVRRTRAGGNKAWVML
ncbi:hypothetical protein DAEQUDRAFT_725102, partial [Daedalea quercina L-15889]